MKTLIEKALLLKGTTLFGDLDLEMILPISDKLGPIQCKPGRPIFSAGEEATHVYLIAEGGVELGGETILGPGQLFGEEAILSGEKRSYGATATEPSLLLALSKANLFATLEECPAFAIGLLKEYAAKVQKRF